MKINMIKEPGGVFRPATDLEHDKTIRFKTGELYELEIKQRRNNKFHGKVFAFFNFCFDYWQGDSVSEQKNFSVFRDNLTVLAGYYDQYVGINGKMRIEAKSISFSSMDQSEFEDFYNDLINAAMKHIFLNDDHETLARLRQFF